MSSSVQTITLNIAIVDDEEEILDAIKLLLEQQQWHVRTYETGEAFLGDLINHKPDCVVLDPHLPGVSGAEVAQTLANDNIPIVGLTALPVSPVTTQVIEAGAWVMLTKPTTEEVLVDQIQAAIFSADHGD